MTDYNINEIKKEHIIDIKIEKDRIFIILNEAEIESDRNNKFTYLRDYFEELKLIKENL